MDNTFMLSLEVIKQTGMFAPFCFILFHVLRQFFFVPVGVLCMMGGVMFGPFLGIFYSVIGITIACMLFYLIIKRLPTLLKRMENMKKKWFGKRRPLSYAQIMILRLIPFVHFHLLSFYLIDLTSSFKEYTKISFLSILPLVVIYTAFGNWARNLSIEFIVLLFLFLAGLFYVMRRREWVIKWTEFFQTTP
ncbi:TVP38/TMEM64 family protein [Bacillus taeanensis]|nr:VTT domain-containing protein [Bacillus taeanensis]